MGAHPLLLVRAPHPPWHLKLLVLLLCVVVSSNASSDSETLLRFKESLDSKDTALGNWNVSTSPCTGEKPNWEGVLCSSKGIVWGLQLENMGLMGVANIDSLIRLQFLRALSIMNNSFEGPMPDIKKLGALKSLYLSNNHFSGEIPEATFAGMGSLKKVYLANNNFTGKIPSSLAALPKILELSIEGNQFEGMIPNFRVQEELKMVNVSNNKLEGPIPARLRKMDKSSFLGNKNLCGEPLDSCKALKKPSASTVLMTVLTVIVLGVAIAAIGAACIILHFWSQAPQSGQDTLSNNPKNVVVCDEAKMERGPTENPGNYKRPEHGKLSFVREDRERFALQDLLRASAEVLHGGSLGFTYKAVPMTGQALVVKRYRHMNNVGREEFQEHMRRLGRLKHPNLLPLVAYYYRKEEKLLVFDYVENGSLAGHLHGKHTADHPSLDWPTRLRIIKGVSKGLAYLYNELPSLSLPHGHLKSSNVLLSDSLEPLLTDYALAPVIKQEHAQEFMVAYKSPEFAEDGLAMKKTDVWNFGILILEILTGKFPANYLQGREDAADLASLVNSIVRVEWTNDVFDKTMGGTTNGEGEMLKLLKIGLECCEEDVENRWDLMEAVETIEELRERDNDEEYYSSFGNERDMYSSRALTDEVELSISMNSLVGN